MKIAILHQNIQGLNEKAKVEVIKNYYRRYLGSTEVICFQEHKLWGARLQAMSNLTWQGVGFFNQKAKVAYNNTNNEDGAGSGGLSMWIAPKLIHLICDSNHTRGGNAQWVRLHKVPGMDLGILNIYAPHSSHERCLLWEELLTSLSRDCRWVFSSDWNFVERAMDKSNLKESIMSELEKRIFGELKDTFQLEDPFPDSNSIRFSWDSKRQDGSRVMARLDRSYASNPAEQQPQEPTTE